MKCRRRKRLYKSVQGRITGKPEHSSRCDDLSPLAARMFRIADNPLTTRTIIGKMLDSAIRTISIARCSTIAAAACFERKVQIWNFATAELVSELDTVFDFGGHRLAVDPSGECCVAASFHAGQKGGVVCYEAQSGRKVWHRADLRRVQGVRFSATGEIIWCRVEGGPIQTLDAHTGLTLGSLRKIRKVFDSPFTSHLLHVPQGDYVIVGSTKLRVPRITSAILDATFSPDALCLSEAATFRSEAGGPVRVSGPQDRRRKVALSAPFRKPRPRALLSGLINPSMAFSGHTRVVGL